MLKQIRSSADRSASRQAFTLIEVLVVVAIIALLISILLPSLKAAREEAKKTLCGSNMHQIGISLTQYVSASKGELPLLYRSSSSFTTYFMRFGNVNGGRVNLGLLANRRYINEPESYYCPGQDAVASASLSLNGPDNKWYSEAVWSSMTSAQRDPIRVRSSYPARLIEVPKKNVQIGSKETWEPMPAGKLTSWRQEKYYQKVIYSDFTGVHGFADGGISDGYVSSPHGKKGFIRLFGDTSARWAHANLLEKLRPINDARPTPEEQVAYYKVLDRIP